MHGTKDQLVSPHQTERLHDALIQQGIESAYYAVNDAQHGGDYWMQPQIMKIVIQFLDKHLKAE